MRRQLHPLESTGVKVEVEWTPDEAAHVLEALGLALDLIEKHADRLVAAVVLREATNKLARAVMEAL